MSECFEVFSDSTCDLPDEYVTQYNVNVVPFYASYDGNTYAKEKVEIGIDEFYRTLANEKVYPKTSLPSIQDYSDAFERCLNKGKDVVCICLSSKLSGSYQSCLNAANMLKDEYPERNICVIDSMTAAVTQGMMVIEVCKLRDRGATASHSAEKIEEIKEQAVIVLTVDSLEYLKRGGRIGKVSAIAGEILGIKPMILLSGGELTPHAKVRGRKKALTQIVDMIEIAVKGKLEDYSLGLTHGDCSDDAMMIKEMVEERLGFELEYSIFRLGITLGSHTGPTAIGIGYIPKL